MNREVKFRGKVVKGFSKDFFKQGFIYGNAIICEDDIESTIINNEFEAQVETDTISQFTGLKDKKGIEIYEGDIVEFYYKGKIVRCEIVWNVKGAWSIKWDNNYVNNYFMNTEKYEVIGNIYNV